MVSHSENFVDPYTGAHSNTTEGVWSQIKRKLKAMNGTVNRKLPSYLDKYNWQKCYPGDPFDNLLEAIAEFCQPNYASDIFLYTSDNILEETFLNILPTLPSIGK